MMMIMIMRRRRRMRSRMTRMWRKNSSSEKKGNKIPFSVTHAYTLILFTDALFYSSRLPGLS